MSDSSTQPTMEQQQELNSVAEATADTVQIKGTNKTYKVGWLHKGTIRKMTDIIISESDGMDDTTSSKLAACIILNGYWRIMLFYWFLWRWFFYVKEYNDEQLQPVIELGKKKVPQVAYYETTILTIGIMDTIQTMTRKEVERFRAELSGGQHTA